MDGPKRQASLSTIRNDPLRLELPTHAAVLVYSLPMTTLRLGSVDLPHAVLDAQEDGRLVLFAGAGVSIPAPSCLPSFKQLARKVAQGVIATQRNEPLDRYLGRAEMEGCKVKEKVKEILSKSYSRPNILHKSLVEIFSDPSTLRIVTTNFDLHFETPISERWPNDGPNIYYAPALPHGGEFSGLLYLHGSLRQPEQMVVTDQDFGKAYLTRGWARRFLQDLFEAYVVVFVGYSHQDTVMNYLARGLPSRRTPTRYALTTSNDQHWHFLGIEPIVYEADETHSRLQEFSRVWATYSLQGVLEREMKIK